MKIEVGAVVTKTHGILSIYKVQVSPTSFLKARRDL